MFSRRAMDVTRQDTKANDDKALTGTYAGSIDREIANMVRKSVDLLDAKAEQIDVMMADWEAFSSAHFGLIAQVLQILGINDFDPSAYEVSVSEDGQVWVVPLEGTEE